MNWGNYLLMSIVITFTNYLLFKCYEKVENTTRFKGTKHILILFISSSLMILNYFVIPFVSRPLFTYVLYLFCLKLIYGSDIKTIVVKGTIVYAFYLIFDFLFSIIVLFTGKVIINNLDNDIVFKSLFTTLVIVVNFSVLSFKFLKKLINKINDIITKNILLVILIIVFWMFIFLISLKFHFIYNYTSYLISLFSIFCFILMLVISIINRIKLESLDKKNDVLLNFISKYEKIIDDNRICKHEMLNNLLILKSFKNKASKEYNELLDNLIDQYNNKSDIRMKNVSRLPKGIKGILYFKISEMENKNIDVNVKISKNVNSLLKRLNNKNYFDLSKIIGIVMDNACEAAVLSSEKKVIIDIYLLNNSVVISIENTYSGNVNLKRINDRYFSSKGKGRGLGLTIINGIVKNNSIINFNQRIYKDIFITEITINKKPH